MAIVLEKLAVLADQLFAVRIGPGGRRSLLLDEIFVPVVVEPGGSASDRPGDAPADCVEGERFDSAARGDARHLTVVIEGDRRGSPGQSATGLFTVGVIGVGVDESARAARCRRQLVVVIEREAGGRRAFGLAGPVSICAKLPFDWYARLEIYHRQIMFAFEIPFLVNVGEEHS